MPKIPFWVFIIIAVIYFTAARVDTMDVDASQYAEISREMLKSGDYLHVYDRGAEYLDKPPFLFWVSATSMKVFGINNFGYKFPSILFALLAIFATYRLARLLYDESTARASALVLATCQGMFLMTNDIRCDTILMSCVITSVWLIQEWYARCKPIYLLAGFAAAGFGMMTKGPIALMVPVFCFASDWALKRQWRNFLRPAYLIGFIIIGLILLPMCIGLYQQYDTHPEKLVNGRHGTSGLRFFFWSQSFGRITGENPWKNEVDLSFLLLNMLWSFLPWIFVLLAALASNVVGVVKQKFRLLPGQEWITTGGFLITYLALGSSSYQLPHYIFVAFPLASIVVARYCCVLVSGEQYPAVRKIFSVMHAIISPLLQLVTLVLIAYAFPGGVGWIAAWVAGFGLWLYLAFNKNLTAKMLWLPASAMIIANIFLTNQVYYTLLDYQAGSHVGKYIKQQKIPAASIIIYKTEDPLNAIDFYANDTLRATDTVTALAGRQYVLTMDRGITSMRQYGLAFDTILHGPYFKVSQLTPEFVNPKTRLANTGNYYLLHMKQ